MCSGGCVVFGDKDVFCGVRRTQKRDESGFHAVFLTAVFLNSLI